METSSYIISHTSNSDWWRRNIFIHYLSYLKQWLMTWKHLHTLSLIPQTVTDDMETSSYIISHTSNSDWWHGNIFIHYLSYLKQWLMTWKHLHTLSLIPQTVTWKDLHTLSLIPQTVTDDMETSSYIISYTSNSDMERSSYIISHTSNSDWWHGNIFIHYLSYFKQWLMTWKHLHTLSLIPQTVTDDMETSSYIISHTSNSDWWHGNIFIHYLLYLKQWLMTWKHLHTLSLIPQTVTDDMETSSYIISHTSNSDWWHGNIFIHYLSYLKQWLMTCSYIISHTSNSDWWHGNIFIHYLSYLKQWLMTSSYIISHTSNSDWWHVHTLSLIPQTLTDDMFIHYLSYLKQWLMTWKHLHTLSLIPQTVTDDMETSSYIISHTSNSDWWHGNIFIHYLSYLKQWLMTWKHLHTLSLIPQTVTGDMETSSYIISHTSNSDWWHGNIFIHYLSYLKQWLMTWKHLHTLSLIPQTVTGDMETSSYIISHTSNSDWWHGNIFIHYLSYLKQWLMTSSYIISHTSNSDWWHGNIFIHYLSYLKQWLMTCSYIISHTSNSDWWHGNNFIHYLSYLKQWLMTWKHLHTLYLSYLKQWLMTWKHLHTLSLIPQTVTDDMETSSYIISHTSNSDWWHVHTLSLITQTVTDDMETSSYIISYTSNSDWWHRNIFIHYLSYLKQWLMTWKHLHTLSLIPQTVTDDMFIHYLSYLKQWLVTWKHLHTLSLIPQTVTDDMETSSYIISLIPQTVTDDMETSSYIISHTSNSDWWHGNIFIHYLSYLKQWLMTCSYIISHTSNSDWWHGNIFIHYISHTSNSDWWHGNIFIHYISHTSNSDWWHGNIFIHYLSYLKQWLVTWKHLHTLSLIPQTVTDDMETSSYIISHTSNSDWWHGNIFIHYVSYLKHWLMTWKHLHTLSLIPQTVTDDMETSSYIISHTSNSDWWHGNIFIHYVSYLKQWLMTWKHLHTLCLIPQTVTDDMETSSYIISHTSNSDWWHGNIFIHYLSYLKQWLVTWKHLPNLTLTRVKHLQEKAKMSLTHGKDTCRHLSLTAIILNSSYDFCFLLWFTHHDNDLQYKRAMPKWSPTIVQPWMRSCCSQHVASAASPCLINLSSLSLQLVWWPEARSCPQRNENKPKFSKWKENKNVFLECV